MSSPEFSDIGTFQITVQASIPELSLTTQIEFSVTVEGCVPTNFSFDQIEDIDLSVGELTGLGLPISQSPCESIYTLVEQAYLSPERESLPEFMQY